uniref:SAM-dependent MTase RsmB/NOP-type domain-containing protein n=1 Tax=Strigamia maritima TaxID=126957 RepID=T1JE95_STRMM
MAGEGSISPYFRTESLKNELGIDIDNSQYFDEILKWLSNPPLLTVVRVNTNQITMENAQKKLKNYLNLEYPRKFTIQQHPLLNDILVIPSLKIDVQAPKNEPEVIVDIHCGAAILRGAHIFAPGVLAAPADLKAGTTVSVYVDLKGKCRKGLITKFDELKTFIGYGTAVLSRKHIFTQQNVKGIAVKMTEPVCLCPSLDSSLLKYFFLQNLPSVICGHVLNPEANHSVLDMCAAPGGKTIHLATIMKNQGRIIALDKTQSKIDRIISNAENCGVTNIKTHVFDSTKAVDSNTTKAVDFCDPPFSPETFDRILLDAPCSGLGQRPQFRIDMSISQLKSYSSLQRKLFANAAQLLKVGGVLVYSTCTITIAENERLVEWALKTFPCLQLIPQVPYLGKCGLDGTSLTEKQLQLLQRFDFRCEEKVGECQQTFLQQTVGFFIAKFVKLKSS